MMKEEEEEEEEELFPMEAGYDFDTPRYLKYPSQSYSSFIPPTSYGSDIFASTWEENNNRHARRSWREEEDDYQRGDLIKVYLIL
jgi:hypothetical protein